MEPDHIDKLLERYLLLLDEYTTLRSTLESLQGAMYQNIARANFSGERGVRYGQDFYDDRMQASRRVVVTLEDGDGGVPRFSTIVKSLDAGCGENEREEKVKGEENAGGEPEKPTGKADPGENESQSEEGSETVRGSDPSENEEERENKTRERRRRIERNRDPLRWFGLVTPTPLRFAQTQGIQIVETVIPRLASVDAEMRNVEIEVRRARKRRAKAEAAPAKTQDGGGGALPNEAAQVSA
ncbi:hypothetical protein VUR80DRAFT_1836 [Thermomyces stellatus]